MKDRQERIAYLCGTTALLFWRAVREGRLARPASVAEASLRSCATTYEELRRIDVSPLGLSLTDRGLLARTTSFEVTTKDARQRSVRVSAFAPQGIAVPPGMLLPCDLMTPERNKCHASSCIALHLFSRGLPAGALCQISDDLMVTSPEMTLVQACRGQLLLPVMELLLELCGTYALPSWGTCAPNEVKPLLTCASMEQFVRVRGLLKGVATARNAVAWAINGLASPREAELYLMLTLPRGYGGFGFKKPKVNARIEVIGTGGERLTTDAYYVVDLLYEEERVVVEYDGAADHELSSEDILRDKHRRNVLVAMGYAVIVVTRDNLVSALSIRQTAEQIARALGVALEPPTAAEAAATEALANWLFNPRHDHLPFGFGYC